MLRNRFTEWLWRKFLEWKLNIKPQNLHRVIPTHILIVEDNKGHYKNLELYIKSICKLDILGCENGEEALKIIKEYDEKYGVDKNPIGVIFLDLRMPKMNGQQFLKELRRYEHKHRYKPLTPIVFLTAYEDADIWSDAYSGEICEYLTKPFNRREVEVVIDKIINDWIAEEMMDELHIRSIERIAQYRADAVKKAEEVEHTTSAESSSDDDEQAKISP